MLTSGPIAVSTLAVTFGVLVQKSLKSNGGYFFLFLPDCDDFYTLHLLNFLTDKRQKILNQGNVGAKNRV
jgi:hypothetical protein